MQEVNILPNLYYVKVVYLIYHIKCYKYIKLCTYVVHVSTVSIHDNANKQNVISKLTEYKNILQ